MSDHDISERTRDAAPPAGNGGLAALPNEPYYQPPAPHRVARNASLGIALVLVGLALLAFQVFGRGIVFGGGTIPLADQRAAGNRIELAVASSDVDVRPWDGADFRIEATQRGGSRGDYSVDVNTSGGTVHVVETSHTFFCLFCSQHLSYRISVPKGAQADIKTTSGDIDVAGVSGAATLATVSGQIHASDLPGGLSAGTTSGDINLQDVGGALVVNTISGDVQLGSGKVSGATINTTSGKIELDGATGALVLGTVSGDIDVRDATRSQLTISTTSGDIDYSGDLAAGATNNVTSISGDVHVDLPPTSGLHLDASTVSGDITSDFDLGERSDGARSLVGVIGDGAANLTIGTTSGDISVEKN